MIVLSRILGLSISVFLTLLLFFGCTAPNSSDLNSLDTNGYLNNASGDSDFGDNYNADASGKVTPFDENISYKLEMTADEDGEKSSFSQYVTKDSARLDIESKEGTARIISNSSGNFVCSLTQETSWTCMMIAGADSGSAASLFARFTSPVFGDVETNFLNMDKTILTPVESRTIAGEETTCYKQNTADGQVEFCLNKRGILFYLDGTNEGKRSTLVVVNYFEEPIGDETFTLPGEVMALPQVPLE